MPESFGPLDPGNKAGAMVQLIRSGLSARAGLAAWREAGGTTGDARWYNLWGQIDDTLRRKADFGSIDPYSLPAPTDYGTWAVGQGGRYVTQVSLSLLDPATGDLFQQYADYFSNEPHTPNEAAVAMIDQWSDPGAVEAYGLVVQGATATSIYQTVPYGT
jgi:hypothetical protein